MGEGGWNVSSSFQPKLTNGVWWQWVIWGPVWLSKALRGIKADNSNILYACMRPYIIIIQLWVCNWVVSCLGFHWRINQVYLKLDLIFIVLLSFLIVTTFIFIHQVRSGKADNTKRKCDPAKDNPPDKFKMNGKIIMHLSVNIHQNLRTKLLGSTLNY